MGWRVKGSSEGEIVRGARRGGRARRRATDAPVPSGGVSEIRAIRATAAVGRTRPLYWSMRLPLDMTVTECRQPLEQSPSPTDNDVLLGRVLAGETFHLTARFFELISRARKYHSTGITITNHLY
ncbi:unnamed protein product [Leptosia nina]|uniref:Uncharacterized protein n=1 Tax=Leptosia nina TaxID=320188 RepID=A0AAV1JR76_9NEOP